VNDLHLRGENITKDYPGTRALDNLSIAFQSGKVNALVGKNGSGKSTLVKIFAGAVSPTAGEVYLNDECLRNNSTSEAFQKGIVTVYQELSLIPYLSVAENVFLGRLPKKNGLLDWDTTYQKTEELLTKMGVKLNPREMVSRLSMWQMQILEITKALSLNPKVILLDEPTSALAHHEVRSLFEAVRALRDQGVVVIYITHKLQELPQIADSVSVLRDGRLIGTVPMREVEQKEIIHMMFGDVRIQNRPKDIKVQPNVILDVKKLTRAGKFHDVSFQVHGGEILGIAGMLGSGRTELLRGIFGADPIDSGEMAVDGKKIGHPNPIAMKRVGVGMTPENRKLEGLILIHSILDNLCYASMNLTSQWGIEDHGKRNRFAKKQVEELEIKTGNIQAACESLSGGNQQKVVVGNWLNTGPRLLLLDEPSRGIDVNAKQQIFEIMWQQARKGIASVFVSTELEELLEVCHRILVMRHGHIVAEVSPDVIGVNDLYEICMEGD
jgi:ribose transport system ATP-binding protein